LRVKYRKRFLRDPSKIPSKTRTEIEKFAFNEPQTNSIAQLGNVERMKGYPVLLQGRFGSYRVGIGLEADIVVFERALHRREIYRYFP
jgi:mRNA interferase RelE/StbE